MTSVHANSAREALVKLTTLPLLAGENVSHRFILPTVASTIDRFRWTIEQMPPPEYLSSGYYERWLWALERLAAEQGLRDGAESHAQRLRHLFSQGGRDDAADVVGLEDGRRKMHEPVTP